MRLYKQFGKQEACNLVQAKIILSISFHLIEKKCMEGEMGFRRLVRPHHLL